ncbi:MAG: hypothetical protein EA404_14660 [Spirochaetaceae bacterium]|nr:MAG: hypothetical protein EA404_14660 [Spirochaetaceae bacterium]
MDELHDVTRPGLMLSQVWPDSRERQGNTANAMELAMRSGQFAAFQTVEVPEAAERRAIRQLMIDGDYQYTYCLTRILNENEFNLSSLDRALRVRSSEVVVKSLDQAREAGADSVSVISGPRPHGETERKQALEALTESMRAVIRAALEPPVITVLLEPLDVAAHKKMTLGYTAEAVAICDRLAREGLPLRLSLDSAHIILNQELPVDALRCGLSYTADFHYCNCVTDPSDPLFGDRHLPFGPPGVVDVTAIAEMMKVQRDLGYFDPDRRPVVMCEVLNQNDGDAKKLMQYCVDTMQAAWRQSVAVTTAR